MSHWSLCLFPSLSVWSIHLQRNPCYWRLLSLVRSTNLPIAELLEVQAVLLAFFSFWLPSDDLDSVVDIFWPYWLSSKRQRRGERLFIAKQAQGTVLEVETTRRIPQPVVPHRRSTGSTRPCGLRTPSHASGQSCSVHWLPLLPGTDTRPEWTPHLHRAACALRWKSRSSCGVTWLDVDDLIMPVIAGIPNVMHVWSLKTGLMISCTKPNHHSKSFFMYFPHFSHSFPLLQNSF